MPTLILAIDARKAKDGSTVFEVSSKRVIGASNKMQSSIARVDNRMKRMGATAGRLRGVMVQLFAGIGVAVALRALVKEITSFEEAMATVRGVTGATDAQFQALTDTARELGATTRFSATQAAEGLLFLARAGFEANEAVTALPATLDLAAAGALDLGEAADIASNVLAQFGLAVEETVRIVDVLVKTSNSANTDVRQLAEALKLAGPIAGTLGITIEETAAAIGVLGNAGIQASLAGTGLRQTFAALGAPTSKARKIIAQMGIEIEKLNPATNTLIEIFTRFREANLTAAQAFGIFGRRAAGAALIITRLTDDLIDLNQKNIDAAGAAEELRRIMDDTLAGAFRNLRSAIGEAFIAIGDRGFGGALRSTVDTMTQATRILVGMGDVMNENVKAATALAIAIGAVGAALFVAVGVGIVSFLASFSAATAAATVAASTFATALGAVLTALAVVGVAILAFQFGKFLFEEFQIVQRGATEFKRRFLLIWEGIRRAVELIFIGIRVVAVESFAFILRQLAATLRKVRDILSEAPDFLDLIGLDPATVENQLTLAASSLDSFQKKQIDGTKAAARASEAAFNQRLAEIELQADAENRLTDRIFQGRERLTGQSFTDFLGKQITEFRARFTGFAVDTGVEDAIAAAARARKAQEDAAADTAAKAESELKKIEVQMKKTQQVADDVGASFANAFENMAIGADSASESIEGLARSILKIAFREAVSAPIAGAVSSLVRGFIAPSAAASPTPNAMGNIFGMQGIIPFQRGGIVSGRSLFGFAGGRTGMLGESGPEAILPLARGPGGRLGVASAGGGGTTQIITVQMNINTPNADSFRKSRRQLAGDARRLVRSATQ